MKISLSFFLIKENQELQSSLGENRFVIRYFFSEEYNNSGRNKIAYFSPYIPMDLKKYLRKCIAKKKTLNLSDALQLISSAISAVEFLHSENVENKKLAVVHRDIKPENIFVSENKHGLSSIIGDLGLVHLKNTIARGTPFCGSLDYLSFDNPCFRDIVTHLRAKKTANGNKLSEDQFKEIIKKARYIILILFYLITKILIKI